MSAKDGSTVLRRFTGPAANELTILSRPDGTSRDAGGQAEAAYRRLVCTLRAERGSLRDLASEMLFLRDIRRDLPRVLAARERVLSAIEGGAPGPLPACIQQPPTDDDAAVVLLASAVVPHDRAASSVTDVRAGAACACGGCTGAGGRLVRIGEESSLLTSNLYGSGGDTYEQACDMFRAAERLLAECGMEFRDVVRTWIHLRDIDRDYDALNAARREFFERSGIEPRPASTGVGGVPFPDAHGCSLVLQAVKSTRPLDVRPMSTPSLNEAWSYGADFSRGLRLSGANGVTLHVSGTASIDEAGRTAHQGDLAAQAERMIHNVASLLAGQGATPAHLVRGVTYVKRASDAPLVRALYRRRGFDSFPCAFVVADLCRPELLCEMEAAALLPRSTSGAQPGE